MHFTLHLFIENFCRESKNWHSISKAWVSKFSRKILVSTPSLHALSPSPPNPFNSSDHWTDGYTDQIGADLTMNTFSKWSVFILVKTKQRHDFWTHQAPAFFAMVFTQRCKQQVSKFSHAGLWRHRFRKSPFPSILQAMQLAMERFWNDSFF